MLFDRRQFGLAALSGLMAGTASLTPRAARAADDKLLNVLVGYAPGGAADTVARTVGDGLRSGGYNAIVDNKSGAGGRLALESLLQAPADGSTLCITPLGNLTIYPHIYRNLRYDPLKDLAPVGTAAGMTFGLAVGAASPAKTLAQFLDLARKDPAMAAFGTPGAGTQMHFLGVMLARQAKVEMTHVPYKGGSAALADAIGGSLPAVITTLPNLLPMHRDGKLRLLAISNTEPLAELPGVPTFVSAGFPDLTMVEVFGYFARAGTSPDAVKALSNAIGASVASAGVQQALKRIEFTPTTMSPAELGERVRTQYARWGEIVKSTGYSAEG